MKQRRYIAWMLMVVSMLMLTASVLPHHHHQHILCLHQDKACECTCEDDHSHEASHHEACEQHCVTNFVSLSPDDAQTDVSPVCLSYRLLYTLADILSIPLPLNDTKASFSYFYLEKLHSTCWWHVIGLRAPPCFVIA